MSSELALAAGTIIQGKWNRSAYRVERLLGGGANGTVYLVSRGTQVYALKVGNDPLDHQSEVNALRALSKASAAFKHYLIDVDDMELGDKQHPYLVIRYVKGVTLKQYIRRHGADWLPLIGTKLLKKLSELHKHGYAYCDLKAENIMVSGYGDVDLIDYGGVTPFGRSVKQFTEVFDRGFWGAGSRKADAAYDLFSFAVLMISLAGSEDALSTFQSSLPQMRNAEQLHEQLAHQPCLRQAAPVLRKALAGQYASAEQALQEWRRVTLKEQPKQRTARTNWLGVSFAVSVVLFAIALYVGITGT